MLIVDNERVDCKIRQRVLFRLGRLDELLSGGKLDAATIVGILDCVAQYVADDLRQTRQ